MTDDEFTDPIDAALEAGDDWRDRRDFEEVSA